MSQKEQNFAESQKIIEGNPNLEICERVGYNHAAYGWSRFPYGHWDEKQKEAYEKGWHQYFIDNNQKPS